MRKGLLIFLQMQRHAEKVVMIPLRKHRLRTREMMKRCWLIQEGISKLAILVTRNSLYR
jgi:hypothetical protein